jgi:uncharacterized cupredoxin-like copper-binding protein
MRLRWALGLLPALILAGCGGSGGSAQNGPVIHVTERDFAITAPVSLPAGDVVLRVRNMGPVAHELLVVREPGSGLPISRDGLTVNEERVQRSEVGVLEPADAHAVRDLPLRLTPGRYILFCNMAGHYVGGMHHELVVR